MTNHIVYKGESNRLHSGFFREHAHIIKQIRNGERDGLYFFDDFNSGGSAQATNAFAWTGGSPAMQYLGYATASTTVKPSNTAGDYGIGVLEIGACNADNDEAYITLDNTYCEAMCAASSTAAAIKPFIFEARVRFSDVTKQIGKFIGLNGLVAPATGDIANGSASLADASYIGYRAFAADPDGMDAVHRNLGGGGEVIVTEAATDDNLDIVASTFKKFGVLFDGTTVKYYVDGRLVDTALPSDTGFPNGGLLVPKLMVRCEETATGHTVGLDWWSLLRVDGTVLK